MCFILIIMQWSSCSYNTSVFHCNIILLAELISLISVTPRVLYSWNTCVDVGTCLQVARHRLLGAGVWQKGWLTDTVKELAVRFTLPYVSLLPAMLRTQWDSWCLNGHKLSMPASHTYLTCNYWLWYRIFGILQKHVVADMAVFRPC